MNINSVTLTGNLTRDPELRELESGTRVANLRIAVNGRRRTADGSWVDTVDYLDVAVFGARAESCAAWLAKGRPIAVQGRLGWREARKGEERREYVKVIAERVEFLGGRPSTSKEEPAGEPAQESLPEAEPHPPESRPRRRAPAAAARPGLLAARAGPGRRVVSRRDADVERGVRVDLLRCRMIGL